jgi:hypothetical protein
MADFIDGRPFGAAIVGVVTLGLGYVAGVSDWALFGLPLSVMASYFAIHR